MYVYVYICVHIVLVSRLFVFLKKKPLTRPELNTHTSPINSQTFSLPVSLCRTALQLFWATFPYARLLCSNADEYNNNPADTLF